MAHLLRYLAAEEQSQRVSPNLRKEMIFFTFTLTAATFVNLIDKGYSRYACSESMITCYDDSPHSYYVRRSLRNSGHCGY